MLRNLVGTSRSIPQMWRQSRCCPCRRTNQTYIPLTRQDEGRHNSTVSNPNEPNWQDRAKTFVSEYGAIGLATHVVLSALSFGSIYASVSYGVDVDKIMALLHLPTLPPEMQVGGNFVVSYAVYKLLTCLRWPITFTVTPIVIKQCRKHGWIAQRRRSSNK